MAQVIRNERELEALINTGNNVTLRIMTEPKCSVITSVKDILRARKERDNILRVAHDVVKEIGGKNNYQLVQGWEEFGSYDPNGEFIPDAVRTMYGIRTNNSVIALYIDDDNVVKEKFPASDEKWQEGWAFSGTWLGFQEIEKVKELD